MKATKASKPKAAKNVSAPVSYSKYLLPVIIVITIFAFYPTLNNGFTSWDDETNVTKNPDFLNYHPDSLGRYFTNTCAIHKDMAMYSPVVRVSYLLQFAAFKFQPFPYHLLNLLLHLLNCALVFYFIWLLCKQQWVAFVTALLFAIHPMHVETVAWVTGRIDEFCSLFYIAALCTYVLYLRNDKWRLHYYALTLALFVFALFSKASAVTLPVAFFALDYFLGQKITLKTILAKAPFFVLSLIFGYIAVYSQAGITAREDFARYHFFDWFLFMCYAITAYLYKIIAPVGLNCICDYPFKYPSGLFGGAEMYPAIFYIAPLVVIAVGWLLYKSRMYGKDVLFGFGFFIINIALVLPGLAVRHAIIADRYTYVSYIGLFFIAARWLVNTYQDTSARGKSLRAPVVGGSVLFVLWCGYLTVDRCGVWHDSITLWTDAIDHSAEIPQAYTNMVRARAARGEGVRDTGEAALRMPTEAYYNRGSVYLEMGKNEEAIKDCDAVIAQKPDFAEAFYNRGCAKLALGKTADAITDFNEVVRLKPTFAEAYSNRGYGYTMLNNDTAAERDFNAAIKLKPDYPEAYSNRGNWHYSHQQYPEAIKDYTTAVTLRPAYAQAYNNRAFAYIALQNYPAALADLKTAKQLNFNVSTEVMNSVEARIGK